MPAHFNTEHFDTDDHKQALTLLWHWAKSTLRCKNPWLASFILHQIQRLYWAIIRLRTGANVLWAGDVGLHHPFRLPRPSKQVVISTVTGTALLLSSVSPAFAYTITVNSTDDTTISGDGQCTLREAIYAANSNASYNECTHDSSPGDDVIDMTTISGPITLGADLPDITESLQLNGPSAAALTLDGGNNYNAIHGTGVGTNVGVDGLTITRVTGDGVHAYNEATVSNSVITGTNSGIVAYNATVSNSTVTGTGIHGVFAYNNATISNSSVISGKVDGLYALNTATITNSTVTGNSGDGVAAVYGDVTITNSSMITGFVDGVFAVYGTATVNNSAVTGITADGVYTYYGKNITINDSTITGNRFGALSCSFYVPFCYTADITATGSTITGTTGDGVATYGNATVISSTISGGNFGVFGYADVLANNSIISGDTVTGISAFTNTIVANNSLITGRIDGIYSYLGYATVSNSTVTGDLYDGIDAGSNATVTNSVISGGFDGVYAYLGSTSVSSSTITGTVGDGIDAYSNATLINSTVTGGLYGLYTYTEQASVHNSTVTGVISDGLKAATNAMVAYSTITGGQSGVVISNTLTLTNSTVSGSGRHGVENLAGNTVTINHSTIANNTGYGIANSGGTTEINNSIIANNGGLGTTRDISGTISTGTHNLIGNGDGSGLIHNVDGNLIGSTGAVLDPQLGPLQNNGGNTATHLPAPGSPAIDAGDPAFSGPPTFDQRGAGFARVLGTLDIGAVEQALRSQPIWLPLILKNNLLLPDLVITGLTASSSDVVVVIQNQGNSVINDAFWVDVYYNLSSPPVLNQKGDLYWGLSGPNGGIPIAPGQEITLNLSSPYYAGGGPPATGTSVYGQVDSIGPFSFGAVPESNEGNNLFGAVSAAASLAASPPPQNALVFNPEGLPLRAVKLSPALPPTERQYPDSRRQNRQARVGSQNDDHRQNSWLASQQTKTFELDNRQPKRWQGKGEWGSRKAN